MHVYSCSFNDVICILGWAESINTPQSSLSYHRFIIILFKSANKIEIVLGMLIFLILIFGIKKKSMKPELIAILYSGIDD